MKKVSKTSFIPIFVVAVLIALVYVAADSQTAPKPKPEVIWYKTKFI